MLNLSENFECRNDICLCCGKPELEWVDAPGSDYPPCEICQACYDITGRANFSVTLLKKIIAFLENNDPKTISK